ALMMSARTSAAADHAGRVAFNTVPVPGATVTATHLDQHLTTVTDPDGVFRFAGLADGAWTLRVEMIGFAPAARDLTIGADTPPSTWALKLLPLSEIARTARVAAPETRA